jgi:hypothetical protein
VSDLAKHTPALSLRRLTLLLAFLVAFAQGLLAVHEISHAIQRSNDVGQADAVCISCLALSGVNGAPVPVHAMPEPPRLLAGVSSVLSLAIAPSAPIRFFLSRAPPRSLR